MDRQASFTGKGEHTDGAPQLPQSLEAWTSTWRDVSCEASYTAPCCLGSSNGMMLLASKARPIDNRLRRAFPSAIQRAPRPTRIDSKIASDHENRSLIPRHRPLLHLTSPPHLAPLASLHLPDCLHRRANPAFAPLTSSPTVHSITRASLLKYGFGYASSSQFAR
jgi:hypothetical protein